MDRAEGEEGAVVAGVGIATGAVGIERIVSRRPIEVLRSCRHSASTENWVAGTVERWS